jgi:hypothetical protein
VRSFGELRKDGIDLVAEPPAGRRVAKPLEVARIERGHFPEAPAFVAAEGEDPAKTVPRRRTGFGGRTRARIDDAALMSRRYPLLIVGSPPLRISEYVPGHVQTFHRGIVTGQIRVVLAGERPIGGVDRGGIRRGDDVQSTVVVWELVRRRFGVRGTVQ